MQPRGPHTTTPRRSSVRVNRKAKIDGKWMMRPVPLDRAGWPDAKHVVHNGALPSVTGGTFYIALGTGSKRQHISCGEDPAAVRRAMRNQQHVLELRRAGMEVPDAPEITESRFSERDSLRR